MLDRFRAARVRPMPILAGEAHGASGRGGTLVGYRRQRTERTRWSDVAPPRDVETFTEVIEALENVASEAEAYRTAVEAFARAGGLAYGACWRPGPDGNLAIGYETSPASSSWTAGAATGDR